jgi:hypothetical protein
MMVVKIFSQQSMIFDECEMCASGCDRDLKYHQICITIDAQIVCGGEGGLKWALPLKSSQNCVQKCN